MSKIAQHFITFILISLSVSTISCSAIQGNIKAPTPGASAINQNTVHKNGCGIASLINAYRFASPPWRAASEKILGRSDQEQFNYVATHYGQVRSRYSPGTNRWEDSSGISSIDLKDLANDFQNKQGLNLPNLRLTTHYLLGTDSYSTLLRQTHSQLKAALRSGFPPIISIKHLTGKKIEGHIVILYEIPSTIAANATAFPIKYVDPLGGIVKSGSIKIPTSTFSSINLSSPQRKLRTLSMDLPQSDIAKHNPDTGDSIILSASIAP